MRVLGAVLTIGLSIAVRAQSMSDSVPDSVIDEAVARLKTGYPHLLDLNTLWSKNPERIIWNYKHANGFLRSRILYSVHANRRSITPLIDLAVKEKAVDLRVMGATLLAEISYGKMSQRNRMLELMTRDRSPLVRRVAAKGLRWQDPNAAQILVRMLRDSNRIVRTEAALSLAYLSDRRGIPVLVESLDYDYTQKEVVWIGGEDPPARALWRFGADVIPMLERKLKNGTTIGKVNAITTLKSLNAPKTFEYGLQLVKHKDPLVRIMAYQAIAWNRKPEAIPILVRGLSDHGHTKYNAFVDSNVAILLTGDTFEDRFGRTKWAEGVAALEKYRSEHPGN